MKLKDEARRRIMDDLKTALMLVWVAAWAAGGAWAARQIGLMFDYRGGMIVMAAGGVAGMLVSLYLFAVITQGVERG